MVSGIQTVSDALRCDPGSGRVGTPGEEAGKIGVRGTRLVVGSRGPVQLNSHHLYRE